MVKKRTRDTLQVRKPTSVRGLSKRVIEAVELMVRDGLSRPQAAEQVGLKSDSLYRSFRNPLVRRYFNDQIEALRTSARPRAFHKIVELAETAVSEKVQLDSAKFVVNGPDRGPRNVINVGVGVGIQVQPGYIVDVSQHREAAVEILKTAGGRSVLDYKDEEGDRA